MIENKGGASGIPGAQACAQAQPDGYTLCLVYHSTMSINPLIFDQLPYDADKDFVPITNLFLLVEGAVREHLARRQFGRRPEDAGAGASRPRSISARSVRALIRTCSCAG